MQHYLSLRDVLIRNVSGSHDQRVPANTPTPVVEVLHSAALAAGCVPCAEDGALGPEAAVPRTKAEVEPDVKPDESDAPAYTLDDVKGCIEELIARNTRTDFNATGRPKVNAVAKLLGFKPSADEINQAWERVETE